MKNKSKIIQQRQLHEYNNITFDCVLIVLITAKGKYGNIILKWW